MSVPFDFEPEFSDILVEWNAPASVSSDGVRLMIAKHAGRNRKIAHSYQHRRYPGFQGIFFSDRYFAAKPR